MIVSKNSVLFFLNQIAPPSGALKEVPLGCQWLFRRCSVTSHCGSILQRRGLCLDLRKILL